MIKRILSYLRRSNKRTRIVIGAAGMIVMIGAGIGVSALLFPKRPPSNIAAEPTTITGLVKESPKYETTLPKDKSIESLGGWTRVSPPDRNAVYAYVDKIGDSRVIVSQQELPKDFVDDPAGKTKELAAAYNAKTAIIVGSNTAYTGVSTGGVESVIFTFKNLLVLIKSDTPLSQSDLKDYINSLV